MSQQMIVTVLRSAVRLNWGRFADPRESHGAGADIPGWRRDHGDGEFELWLLPAYWRGVFEPDIDAVEAAQVLDRLGLLRRQDDGNLQTVVKVGGRAVRVYAIDGKALAAWKVTARCFGGYGRTDTPELASASPASLVSQENTADLATRLERGVSRALDEALDILNTRVGRDDRAYQAILRAKATIVNTLVSAQIRVDEHKLRARQTDELLPKLLESLKIEQEKLSKIKFRRTLDDDEQSAPSAPWDESDAERGG
jgi:hypothetical protein